jgi:hypothetical protein
MRFSMLFSQNPIIIVILKDPMYQAVEGRTTLFDSSGKFEEPQRRNLYTVLFPMLLGQKYVVVAIPRDLVYQFGGS